MIFDRVHVLVQAGNGGNGCESYYRRNDKKIVPNGGDGGRGGRVIFQGNVNAPSLASFRFRQHLIADSGGHGGSNRKRGKTGKDLLIYVPIGTRIYDRKRNFLIRELLDDQEQVVVLEGGTPGIGNDGGKQASLGEKGKRLELDLRYHIPADVFFVGLPNGGKSTLLNALTRAHVKEADYPFATKTPEVGVCLFSDYERIMICELPSVYKGSQDGRGRGLDFLRHLEYAQFILYIVDPVSEFAESPEEGFKTLRAQLSFADEKFLDIPYGVVITKSDLMEQGSDSGSISLKDNAPTFVLSAKTGQGVEALKEYLKDKFFSESHA